MNGIYILEIEVKEPRQIKVGALGRISFEKGRYAYVGSAQNSINSRVKRHFSSDKKKHWHIDYLLSESKIRKVFVAGLGKEHECITAQKLAEKNEPIAGFGCSDCNCVSHLFRLNHQLKLRGFKNEDNSSFR